MNTRVGIKSLLLLIGISLCLFLFLPVKAFGGGTAGVDVTATGVEPYGAPEAETLPATNITTVTAILWGNVTDSGGGCHRGFEWGFDVGYGNSWYDEDIHGNGTYSHQISINPGTEYHFRASTYNAEGWGNGTDEVFLTSPVAPSDFSVSRVNETAVELTWTKGGGAIATTVIRRDSGAYPTSPTGGDSVYNGTGSSFVDTELDLSSSVYYYRAWTYFNGEYSSEYAQVNTGSLGVASNFLFLGLILLAGILTYVSLKVRLILFRIGAALSWLTLGILLLTGGLGTSMGTPWTQVLGFVFLVMTIATLSLQFFTEVKREKPGFSWSEFKSGPVEGKGETRSQRIQRQHKEELRRLSGRSSKRRR